MADPARRRRYDSTLPFDEKIPKMDIDPRDFYEEYSKCFDLNSKFSDIRPVPDMGDEDTPMEEVRKFYKFWDDFKSWREFSQYDEHDVEKMVDVDRYEKRHMEKENKKLRATYEKAERKRLFRLVENAYNSDPRIQKELAAEEEAKIAAKNARKLQNAQKWAAPADTKKAEEAAKLIEKEAAEVTKKLEKEVKRLAGKKYRETAKELGSYCESKMPGTKFDKFFVAELVKKYAKQEALDELVSKI